MKSLSSLWLRFLFSIVVLITASCGNRTPLSDDQSGGFDNRAADVTAEPNRLGLVYDQASDLFVIVIYISNSIGPHYYRIDFPNDKASYEYDGLVSNDIQYICTKKINNFCKEFHMSGLPFGGDKMVFTKENLEITALDTGKKTIQSVIKAQNLIQKYSDYGDHYFSVMNNMSGIGYSSSYEFKMSDGIDSMPMTQATLPGELSAPLDLYEYNCRSTTNADLSASVSCKYTHLVTNEVIEKSWRIKLIY